MAESVFAHRVAVETEAAELSAKRRLDTTLRVHSDSKLPPKDAPSRKPLLKPCWIESEPVRASYADNAIFHQGHTERRSLPGQPWVTFVQCPLMSVSRSNRRGKYTELAGISYSATGRG